MKDFYKGQEIEWVTRPTPAGYLHGIVIKVGPRKVGIAVQNKTGEWKPKWAELRYIRAIRCEEVEA
jgi:hypothetical protein